MRRTEFPADRIPWYPALISRGTQFPPQPHSTRTTTKPIKMQALDWLKCSTQNTSTLIQPIEGVHFYRSRFRSRYRGLCDRTSNQCSFFLQLGHQDFYPNKGTFMQPKCLWKVACSHMRAYDFYLSSIKNFDIQPGQPCSFVTEACCGTTCSGTCPRMGIHAKTGDGSGSFSITMTSSNCGCAYIV